jgi:hypothetical protein
MSLRPVITEEVCSIGAPGLTVDVEGDEVEIGREYVFDVDAWGT